MFTNHEFALSGIGRRSAGSGQSINDSDCPTLFDALRIYESIKKCGALPISGQYWHNLSDCFPPLEPLLITA